MPHHPGPPPGPAYPLVVPHAPPRGSRFTLGQWSKANSGWGPTWSHADGVAEAFPWGSVLWAVHGLNPYGMVITAPDTPVEVAHRAAAELSSGQLASFSPRLPLSKRTLLGAVVPLTVVGGTLSALAVNDAVLGVGAVVSAGVGGAATGFRQRLGRWRQPWRHVTDPEGISALMPHLLWIADVTDEASEHADLVWSGVRQILWDSRMPRDAVEPVERISLALASAVAARRRRDVAVDAGLPPETPPGPDDVGPQPSTERIDAVAAGVVGALGFEEDVYLRVAEDYENEKREPE